MMLLGFSPPTDPAYTLSGAGAGFLTDVRLSNGKPSQQTRVQWLDEVSPSTSDYLDLRCTFNVPQRAGVIYLLGLSLPEGVEIVVTARTSDSGGAFDVDLGGNSKTQTTRARFDGRVRHIVVPTYSGLVTGVQWRIPNDLGGSTWADADTVLDIGEACLMDARYLNIKPNYTEQLVETSELVYTLGSQPHRTQRRNRRELSVSLTPRQESEVREEGLSGTDWWRIEAALMEYQPLFVSPTAVGCNGDVVDTVALHEEGFLGVSKERGAFAHYVAPGLWYERAISFAEAPER